MCVQLRPLLTRLALLAGIVYSGVWVFEGPPKQLGISVEVGNNAAHVSGGSSPLALALSALLLMSYVVTLNTRIDQHSFRIAPLWRRTGAWIIDSWVGVFSFGSLGGFVSVASEALRLGVFRWQFQRNYLVATDYWISLALLIAGLAAFVAYFLLPLMLAGQTVGSWIFRVVTVNADSCIVRLPFRIAMNRLLAVLQGAMSPIKTIRKRDSQGRTQYDIKSGFTVVTY